MTDKLEDSQIKHISNLNAPKVRESNNAEKSYDNERVRSVRRLPVAHSGNGFAK